MTLGLSTLPHTLATALRLVWGSSRRLCLVNLLLTPLQAALPLVSLYLLKRAVDVAAQVLSHGATSRIEAWRPLFGIGLAAGAVLLAGILVRALLSWYGQALQFVVDDRVRSGLHARLLELDVEFFESPEGLDRLHLARDQALQRPMSLVNGLLQLLRAATLTGGLLGLLVSFRWWLPLVLLAGAVPAIVLRLYRSRRLYAWRQKLVPLEREAGWFDRVLSGGLQAKELRVYGHGPFFQRRFAELRAALRAAQLRWRRFVLCGDVAAQGVGLAVAAAAIVWLSRDVLAGGATIGGLVMSLQAINRGQSAVGGVVGGLVGLYEDALFLQGYEDLMQHPVRIQPPAQPKAPPRRVREGLVFNRVTFGYPGAARPALRDVSFTLRPGERVVLAGGNGSGKSTLVKLLCRLYDPASGAIRVDGTDLRDFDPAAWRQRLGVLFQDFGAYPLSARENIWFGDVARDPGAPAIAEAAARAGVDETIRALPRAYDSRLGRLFADGVELSIGQWQRLALARAFCRDSALFVLDEPTSALDGVAQRAAIAALDAWREDRVVLLATHGPGAIRADNRVLVLRDGALVEQGTASALVAAGGEFARLFAAEGRGV